MPPGIWAFLSRLNKNEFFGTLRTLDMVRARRIPSTSSSPRRLRRARSIFVPGLAAPAPAAFSLRLTFSRILLTVKHSCSLAREGFEGPEIV